MKKKPVGSVQWLEEERDYIVNEIEWYQQHIDNLERDSGGSKSVEYQEYLDTQNEYLEKLLGDLRLLKKDWREYAKRFGRR